jgi:Tfp pilus assembly protein PilV
MMVYNMSNILQKAGHKKGFSVVEALIAISILSVGLTAGMTLLASSMRVVSQTNDATVATYLASEGIEIVREARDSAILTKYNAGLGGTWDGAFSGCNTANGKYCLVDSISSPPTIQVCTGTPCTHNDTALYMSTASGSAGQYTIASSGNTLTNFKREVGLTPVPTGDGYKITSTVSYTNRGTTNTISMNDFIYNTGAF